MWTSPSFLDCSEIQSWHIDAVQHSCFTNVGSPLYSFERDAYQHPSILR
jgi:hypothetical protein